MDEKPQPESESETAPPTETPTSIPDDPTQGLVLEYEWRSALPFGAETRDGAIRETRKGEREG
jgi:hypothetical protein